MYLWMDIIIQIRIKKFWPDSTGIDVKLLAFILLIITLHELSPSMYECQNLHTIKLLFFSVFELFIMMFVFFSWLFFFNVSIPMVIHVLFIMPDFQLCSQIFPLVYILQKVLKAYPLYFCSIILAVAYIYWSYCYAWSLLFSVFNFIWQDNWRW